jgi:hypothetical protein
MYRISVCFSQQGRECSPFVAFIGRSSSIFILFPRRHSVPLRGLRVVSPSIIEECGWVLYDLKTVSTSDLERKNGGQGKGTYTHPDADNQQPLVCFEVPGASSG